MSFTDELHQILIDFRDGEQPGESINAIKKAVECAIKTGEIKIGNPIIFKAEDLELR